ncbi:MAG: dihydropteroate synthase [Betaproteobacteria bacterium]|nr:dihydropteroate synthase [Betaproteobacteria bacterium]
MNSSLHTSGAQRCHALMDRTKTVYQGIINVTPDSFSDGGQFDAPESAVAQALKLVQQGAHIVDVGGVSTRPGALEISAEAELERVLPVLKALRSQLPTDVLVSLDTSSPTVAYAAAQENLIDIINDVYSARKTRAVDTALSVKTNKSQAFGATTAHVAGHFDLGFIAMHMQGTPSNMQRHPNYENCVDEVALFLQERIEFARNCGVHWVAVDPGIGFGKTLAHNLELLCPAALAKLNELGAPVLIGLSRKSFLKMLAEAQNALPLFASKEAEMQWRDQQSALWEENCVNWGARIIRTHVIKPVS